MPKLINVDEARAYAREHFPSPVVRRPIEEVLDRCPGVERVPDINVGNKKVVLCKDCKWLLTLDSGYFCIKHSGLAGPSPDGFCNFGNRRDNE